MNEEFNSIKMSQPILKKSIECKCSLGEGLYVDGGIASWVDIETNEIYIASDNQYIACKLNNKPSVIFSFENKREFVIGSDIGIVMFDYKNNHEVIKSKIPKNHDYVNLRSNDGCNFGNLKLLGFMSRNDPKNNRGLVYSIKDSEWDIIDDSLSIPNSFIQIDENTVLISDSLENKIWKYSFSKCNLKKKEIWADFNYDLIPDGGCFIDNYIYIAFWDAALIKIFDLSGNEVSNINLPIKRPTNCKFDEVSSELWVTSASIELSKNEIKDFPMSGNTFIYNLGI